jgi:hypothetical protein
MTRRSSIRPQRRINQSLCPKHKYGEREKKRKGKKDTGK